MAEKDLANKVMNMTPSQHAKLIEKVIKREMNDAMTEVQVGPLYFVQLPKSREDYETLKKYTQALASFYNNAKEFFKDNPLTPYQYFIDYLIKEHPETYKILEEGEPKFKTPAQLERKGLYWIKKIQAGYRMSKDPKFKKLWKKSNQK